MDVKLQPSHYYEQCVATPPRLRLAHQQSNPEQKEISGPPRLDGVLPGGGNWVLLVKNLNPFNKKCWSLYQGFSLRNGVFSTVQKLSKILGTEIDNMNTLPMPVEVEIPQPELPEEEPELARILRAPTLELGGENVEVSEKQNGSDGLDGVPVANTAPVEPNKPDEPEKTEPEKTEPEKTEAKKTDQEKPEEKKTDPEKTEPEKTEPEVPMVTRAEQQRFKKHKKGVETVQEEPEKVETKKSKGRGRGERVGVGDVLQLPRPGLLKKQRQQSP